jgi:hypothetical protein
MTSIKLFIDQTEEEKMNGRMDRSIRTLSATLMFGVYFNILIGIFLIGYMMVVGFIVFGLLHTIISFEIAGVLFWCDRLLKKRMKSILIVFLSLVLANWCYSVIVRIFIFTTHRLYVLDFFSIIIPVAILLELYRYKKKGVLT